MAAEADAALIEGIRRADRRALAKAITLLESTLPEHRQRATALLDAVLAESGKSIRVGISGPPGVGKSTFIEALGMHLVERGHRVAVLAVDPSSVRTGGSILGDKTRMERLSASPSAYIRPSPSQGALGGVAERTREAILVCEAAGYDIVLVETVGVGQSEATVARMTDLFLLLQLPNAGDDLQALKKGVLELADAVVVNKMDLDPAGASRTLLYMNQALRVQRATGNPEHAAGHRDVPVLLASGLTAEGLEAVWTALRELAEHRRGNGQLDERRHVQAIAWMWELVHTELQHEFNRHPAVRAALEHTLAAVGEAKLSPASAASALLACFRK